MKKGMEFLRDWLRPVPLA